MTTPDDEFAQTTSAHTALDGYARVSTEDQNFDNQTKACTVASAGHNFSYKINGLTRKRPELDRAVRAGANF